MITGTVLVKNAEQSIPDELLSKVLEKHNTCVGMAYAEDGHLHVTKVKKAMPLLAFQNIQANEKFKDKQIVFFLQSASDALLQTEDMQPFILVNDDKNNPLIVAFLDGVFDSFAEAASTHSAQFFAIQKDLLPRIQKAYKFAGNDLKKFMDELSDKLTYDDIVKTMISDRGSIVIMTGTGDITAFTVEGDETREEFSFGWASNTYGYVEGTAEEVETDPLLAAAAVAPKSEAPAASQVHTTTASPKKFSRASAKPTMEPAPVVVAKPAAAPTNVKSATLADRVPQADSLTSTDESVLVTVPTTLHGKKRVKFFRKRLDGFLPSDHERITQIRVKKSTFEKLEARFHLPKSFKEALGVGDNTETAVPEKVITPAPASITAPAASATPAVSDTAPPRVASRKFQRTGAKKIGEFPERAVEEKVPEAAPAPAAAPAPSKGVVAQALPLIPIAQRAEIAEMLDNPEVKAAVDRHSIIMGDPLKFQEEEQKVPDFATQLKHPGILTIEDTKNWPLPFLFDMGRACPDAAIVWGYNWMCMALKLLELQKVIDVTGTEEERPQVSVQQAPTSRFRRAGKAA